MKSANKATKAKKASKVKTFLAFLASLAFLANNVEGATQGPDPAWIRQQEAEIEREINNKTRDILDKMLGPTHESNISVSVSYVSGGETQTKTVHTKSNIDDRTWILPGIPNPNRGSGAPIDQEVETTQKPIKWRKVVSIIMNEEFKARIQTLKDLLLRTLELTDRDLTITTAPFAKQSAGEKAVSSIGQDKGLLLVVMAGFAMLIFTIFLFGPIRGFLKGMSNALGESKARQFSIEMGGAGGPGLGGGATSVMAGGPAGMMTATGQTVGGMSAGAMGSGGTVMEALPAGSEESVVVEQMGGGAARTVKYVRPFSFIKKANIPNLVYLVQEEPPEIVGLIMSYLNPEEGAELMSALPADLQTKVAISMATVKQASHESVVRAEEAIRKKLDFLVGGVERFINILDRVDPATREEILATLGKDSPALVERVKRELFTFENLNDLDDPALQLVLREVKTESLAKALKEAPEVLVEKVKKNISAGAQTLLAEEMQLQGYVTPLQVDEERRKIIDVVRKMEKEGKIAIRRAKYKAEKVERIKSLEEALGLPAGSASAGLSATGGYSETAVGLPSAQRSSVMPQERKVGLSDYEGRKPGQALSMASIFKQNPPSEKLVGPAVAAKERLVGATEPLAADPGDEHQQAMKHYQDGSTAYNERAYEPAIAAYKKCVELDPNFWQGYQGLGNGYTALGMVTEAIKAYEEALTLQPNNPGLRQWLDDYKSKQGA